MDHRQATRTPVSIPVMIYHHGLPEVIGVTRDVSVEGMFVCVEGAGFSRHAVVELEIPFDTSEGKSIHTRAMIVRVEPNGLAVAFDGEAAVRGGLRNIVESHAARQP